MIENVKPIRVELTPEQLIRPLVNSQNSLKYAKELAKRLSKFSLQNVIICFLKQLAGKYQSEIYHYGKYEQEEELSGEFLEIHLCKKGKSEENLKKIYEVLEIMKKI